MASQIECARCGVMFWDYESTWASLCEDCGDKDEEEYQKNLGIRSDDAVEDDCDEVMQNVTAFILEKGIDTPTAREFVRQTGERAERRLNPTKYLDCPMCGASNSFSIDPNDGSRGYCSEEATTWVIKRTDNSYCRVCDHHERKHDAAGCHAPEIDDPSRECPCIAFEERSMTGLRDRGVQA